MAEFAFAIPVLRNKENLDRKTLGEMSGARRYENAGGSATRKDHMADRLAPAVAGGNDCSCVCRGRRSRASALGEFGSSDEPFNGWFRDEMKEVHGVDISEPGPPAEKVFDAQTS